MAFISFISHAEDSRAPRKGKKAICGLAVSCSATPARAIGERIRGTRGVKVQNWCCRVCALRMNSRLHEHKVPLRALRQSAKADFVRLLPRFQPP